MIYQILLLYCNLSEWIKPVRDIFYTLYILILLSVIFFVMTTNIFLNGHSLSRERLYIVAQRVTKYKESAVYDFREPRRQNPRPLENIIYFLAGGVYEGRLNCRLRGEQIYTAICYVGSFHKSAPFPLAPAHGQTINWVLGPVDNTGVTRHDRSPLCNPSL